MSYIPILNTQFSPPAVKESFVRRAKVHRKITHIPKYPLTLLHSGAGYGKSTALSLYAHDANVRTCWYSISAYDDDFVPFLTKLTHAIKFHYPSFGENLLNDLEHIENYVHDQEIWSFMTMMVNEVGKLEEEILLILDDFHHVDSSQMIELWMKHFIENIPTNLHLVLSSRSKPRWKVLTNLKVKGELLEIKQEDLILGLEEVEHLLVDIYQLPLTKEQLMGVHEVTEGWAIAFGMIIQQLQNGYQIEDVLINRKNSLEDLFDYLAMEVLSKQSPIIQKFLEQTSVLEILSGEACDAILGMNGSAPMLEDLAKQNLFIQAIDQEHYRFHALFKEFLQNQMKQHQPRDFKQMHSKAARFYEQKEDLESAIFHLEQINESGRAAQLLVDYGLVMLKNGKLQSLFDRIQHIPEREKDYFPILWYYEGEVYRYRSLYKQAEQCYELAIKHAQKQKDIYFESLGYEGKARIYLDTISPDQAERILQVAIDLREQVDTPKEEKSRLYHLLAENLLNAGQAQKAEMWFQKAKGLGLPLEEGNLEARLYLRTGQLEKAKELLVKRQESIPFNETKHLPQSHRETEILLSIIDAFMGNAESSKVFAQNGIHQGMRIQAPFVEACGWIRLGHAVQLLNRYQPGLAEQCYTTALDMMEKINVSRGKAEPYMGLCILYGLQGEYEQAHEMGQKGLMETEKVKDLWLSSLIQLCMAISAVYCNRMENAKEILMQVELQFDACGDQYGLMLVSFWKAYIAFELEDKEEYKIEMKTFLQKLQAGKYEFFLKRRTTFGPIDMQNFAPILLAAQQEKIYENYVTKIINELGFSEMDHHPGFTLRIKTLGNFKVWLGTQEVTEKDWQRGTAKELFELFVTKRSQLLQKEEIFQAIWPEQDEESANRSFKVALNALLKTLEPERKARAESFFIKRSGSAYGLNQQAGFDLDIAAFEEWITLGLEESNPERVKDLLQKGLALYDGDYLPERRLEDWCLNERERLQVLYLRAAEKLAQVSVRLLDFDLCIHWCGKILDTDQTWEEAYRLLMYGYYQKNNRPQSLKWYQRCCEVLERELGVEPMQTTKEMYQMIKESTEFVT